MSVAEVEAIVIEYLENRDRTRFDLSIEPDGIWSDGDWWNVVVRPDKSDVRAYEYADALSEVELKIRDEKGLKVLLVPAIA